VTAHKTVLVSKNKWKKILPATQKVAWACFLVTLPITSFPYFPETIGGGTVVRPLSLYPLIILVFLVTIPRLFSKPIPRTVLSLLPFVLIAVASSLLALFRGVEPVLGIPVTERVLRAMLTLGIGGLIYLTAVVLPRSIADLRFTMRWLYLGVSLAMFWGSLQAIYVLRFNPIWFDTLGKVQQYLSIRRLFGDRISGLTYEPNWFAEQLSFLLLPWLLSSVISGYTVFRWRWRWLTIEAILLGWSILLLPFTFSRAGVLNALILILFSVLIFRFLTIRSKSKDQSNQQISAHKPKSTYLRPLIEAFIILVFLVTQVYLIGTKNIFFTRVWEYWQRNNPTLSGYLSYIGFGARLSYSEAAFNTYEQYPFLGVGLGNFAYYFEEQLPYRPLADSPEILRLITPEEGRNRLITIKNFYLRLLAETGIIGAAAFMSFLIAVLGCGLFLLLSSDKEQVYWGIAGLCGLISFSISALTFDSFVFPNMWLVFGITTAAAWIFKRSKDSAATSILNSDSP